MVLREVEHFLTEQPEDLDVVLTEVLIGLAGDTQFRDKVTPGGIPFMLKDLNQCHVDLVS